MPPPFQQGMNHHPPPPFFVSAPPHPGLPPQLQYPPRPVSIPAHIQMHVPGGHQHPNSAALVAQQRHPPPQQTAPLLPPSLRVAPPRPPTANGRQDPQAIGHHAQHSHGSHTVPTRQPMPLNPSNQPGGVKQESARQQQPLGLRPAPSMPQHQAIQSVRQPGAPRGPQPPPGAIPVNQSQGMPSFARPSPSPAVNQPQRPAGPGPHPLQQQQPSAAAVVKPETVTNRVTSMPPPPAGFPGFAPAQQALVKREQAHPPLAPKQEINPSVGGPGLGPIQQPKPKKPGKKGKVRKGLAGLGLAPVGDEVLQGLIEGEDEDEEEEDAPVAGTSSSSSGRIADAGLAAALSAWQVIREYPQTKEKPDGFRHDLHLYQKEVLAWMVHRETSMQPFPPNGESSVVIPHRGGMLALDMGLGKTAACIALLGHRARLPDLTAKEGGSGSNSREAASDDEDFDIGRIKRKSKRAAKTRPDKMVRGGTLVIAPKAILNQWMKELNKFLGDEATGFKYHTSTKKGMTPKLLSEYDMVITTYETLKWEFSSAGQDALKVGAEELKRKDRNSIAAHCEDGALAPFCPLYGVRWTRVVLDESAKIKNSATLTFLAVHTLCADNRWCLNGTPIHNRISDLESQLAFLRCPCTKAESEAHPAERGVVFRLQKSDTRNGGPLVTLPEKKRDIAEVQFTALEKEFYDALQANAVQMVEYFEESVELKGVYFCVLELLLRQRQACNHPLLVIRGLIKKGYSQFFPEMELDEDGQVREAVKWPTKCCKCHADPAINALVTPCSHTLCWNCIMPGFGKLRSLKKNKRARANAMHDFAGDDDRDGDGPDAAIVLPCPECGRRLYDSNLLSEQILKVAQKFVAAGVQGSSKLDHIVEYLCGLPQGEKAVVFSVWTSALDILEVALDKKKIKHCRYDGTMTTNEQDSNKDMFDNDPKVKVMLVSLMSGGVGLNLVAACHAILVDLWWNPAVEDQAIDRVHRINQTKPVKVFITNIKETVEDRILEMQREKRAIADGFLRDVHNEATSMNAHGPRALTNGLNMREMVRLLLPSRPGDGSAGFGRVQVWAGPKPSGAGASSTSPAGLVDDDELEREVASQPVAFLDTEADEHEKGKKKQSKKGPTKNETSAKEAKKERQAIQSFLRRRMFGDDDEEEGGSSEGVSDLTVESSEGDLAWESGSEGEKRTKSKKKKKRGSGGSIDFDSESGDGEKDDDESSSTSGAENGGLIDLDLIDLDRLDSPPPPRRPKKSKKENREKTSDGKKEKSDLEEENPESPAPPPAAETATNKQSSALDRGRDSEESGNEKRQKGGKMFLDEEAKGEGEEDSDIELLEISSGSESEGTKTGDKRKSASGSTADGAEREENEKKSARKKSRTPTPPSSSRASPVVAKRTSPATVAVVDSDEEQTLFEAAPPSPKVTLVLSDTTKPQQSDEDGGERESGDSDISLHEPIIDLECHLEVDMPFMDPPMTAEDVGANTVSDHEVDESSCPKSTALVGEGASVVDSTPPQLDVSGSSLDLNDDFDFDFSTFILPLTSTTATASTSSSADTTATATGVKSEPTRTTSPPAPSFAFIDLSQDSDDEDKKPFQNSMPLWDSQEDSAVICLDDSESEGEDLFPAFILPLASQSSQSQSLDALDTSLLSLPRSQSPLNASTKKRKLADFTSATTSDGDLTKEEPVQVGGSPPKKPNTASEVIELDLNEDLPEQLL